MQPFLEKYNRNESAFVKRKVGHSVENLATLNGSEDFIG
jgi:hypothetical protein